MSHIKQIKLGLILMLQPLVATLAVVLFMWIMEDNSPSGLGLFGFIVFWATGITTALVSLIKNRIIQVLLSIIIAIASLLFYLFALLAIGLLFGKGQPVQ